MNRRRFLQLAGTAAGLAFLGRSSERLPPERASWALTAAPAGGWTVVNQPRAAYFNGKTYFGYVRGDNGSVCIRSYDHATRTVSDETVMHAGLQVDNHAAPSVLIRSADHRILAVYSAHGSTTAVYAWVSARPESVAAGVEINLHEQVGAADYTYPAIAEASGRLLLFYRSFGANRQRHAGARWGYSVSDDGGASWSRNTDFWNAAGRGVYAFPRATAADRIDLALLDGNPTGDSRVGIFHMFTDGMGFYRTDGTRVSGAPPWRRENASLVYRPLASDRAGPASVALGTDGRPRIAFPVLGPDRLHWTRWDGRRWLDQDVAPGYDRPELDPVDADSMYVERPAGERPGLVHLSMRDGGQRSTIDEIATPWSTAESHRVCVPQDRHPELGVVWLYGTEPNDQDFNVGIGGARIGS